MDINIIHVINAAGLLQWYYRKVRFSTVVGPMHSENNTYTMRCDTILWVWEEGEKCHVGKTLLLGMRIASRATWDLAVLSGPDLMRLLRDVHRGMCCCGELCKDPTAEALGRGTALLCSHRSTRFTEPAVHQHSHFLLAGRDAFRPFHKGKGRCTNTGSPKITLIPSSGAHSSTHTYSRYPISKQLLVARPSNYLLILMFN